MEEISITLDKTLDKTTTVLAEQYQLAELAVYSAFAFLLPLLFPSSQLATGTIVNCALVLAALRFKGWKFLPIAILPSVAAFLNGMIFGPASFALLYMIPFIWAGNILLVYLVKKMHAEKGLNYALAAPLAVVAKSALLFSVAVLLLKLALVPAAFLFAMGMLQMITGLSGALAALLLDKALCYLLK